MANNEGFIDQVVSEASLQNIAKLRQDLGTTNAEIKKVIQSVVALNSQLSGGVSMKESANLQKQIADNLAILEKASRGYASSIVEVNKAVEKANGTMGRRTTLTYKEIKGMDDLTKAISQNTSATQANTKAVEESGKLRQAVAKIRDDAAAKAKQEQKIVDDLTNEYKIQSRALTELQLRFKNLALTVGENHPLTVQAQNDANKLRETLYRLDTAVGDHRRNVGNYNSIAMNMGQVLRELPNAGMGARTFIMSLSNNLVPLGESIANVVRRNRELAATGQPTVSVLKQLGSSVFGITGILSIATTGLILFSDWVTKSGDSAKKAKPEIDALQDSIEKTYKGIIDNEKAAQNAEDKGENALRRNIALLKAKGATQTQISKAEVALKKQEISNLEKERDMFTALATGLNELQFRSAGRDAEEFLNKFKDGLVVTNLTKDQRESIVKMEKDFRSGALSFDDMMSGVKNKAEELEKYFNRKSTEVTEQIKDRENDITVAEAEAAKDREKRRIEEAKKTKELRDRNLRAELGYIAESSAQNADHYRDIFSDEKESLDTRLAALDYWALEKQNSIAASATMEKQTGEKTAKEVVAIERKKQDDITAVGVEAAKLRAKAIRDAEEQAEKDQERELSNNNAAARGGLDNFKSFYERNAEEEIAEEDAKGARIHVIRRKWMRVALRDIDEQIGDLRKVQGVQQDTIDAWEKAKGRLKKSIFKEDTQVIRETLEDVRDVSNSILDGMNSLSFITANNIAAIDAELAALQRKHEVTMAQINAEVLSEEDKNKRIAQAEADLEGKRATLEAQKKEQLKKKAIADKVAAVYKAIINTAIAVTENLSNPWKAAAIGFAGAAAVAQIAAAPLPTYDYAKGTASQPGGVHPGGPANVGDGGKHELMRTPDGRWLITPNVTTHIPDMAAGTKVLPDAVKALSDGTVPGFADVSAMFGVDMSQVVKSLESEGQKNRHYTARLVEETQETKALLRRAINKKPFNLIGRDTAGFYDSRNRK